ncbi:MAG: rhodanese domain-containing protein [Gammaproteobacteria bacterium]|nr:rhodanese domain-containing protein [Gammaproteobacteria bacterium]
MSAESVVIRALYRFTAVAEPERLRRGLLAELRRNGVVGTLIVAAEGINGTIAGRRDGVDAALAWLRRQPGLDGLEAGESYADAPPFKRARVKVRREIVTLGLDAPVAVDAACAGQHVDAADWNKLIDDEATLVIDTRNQYETRIGGFAGAVDPRTTNFRDFPAFVARELMATESVARESVVPESTARESMAAESTARESTATESTATESARETKLESTARKHRPIAMYCTGGIRCEKASAYLKRQGFEQVFQLRGGILKYLETVPAEESRWRGECFVFDERVSVDHGLRRGRYAQCHACRMPISAADKRSEKYTPGASCPHCFERISADRRERFLQREKQVALAAARGRAHFGPEAMADSKAALADSKAAAGADADPAADDG